MAINNPGNRVGGIIRVNVDGREVRAKGGFTYNLGLPKRDAVIGTSEVHGYTEKPQPAFIEGAITDTADLDLKALMRATNATVILDLANGKTVVLRDAYYAAEGEGSTEEGEVKVKWESPYEGEMF